MPAAGGRTVKDCRGMIQHFSDSFLVSSDGLKWTGAELAAPQNRHLMFPGPTIYYIVVGTLVFSCWNSVLRS